MSYRIDTFADGVPFDRRHTTCVIDDWSCATYSPEINGAGDWGCRLKISRRTTGEQHPLSGAWFPDHNSARRGGVRGWSARTLCSSQRAASGVPTVNHEPLHTIMVRQHTDPMNPDLVLIAASVPIGDEMVTWTITTSAPVYPEVAEGLAWHAVRGLAEEMMRRL